jgi:hypothetical protein
MIANKNVMVMEFADKENVFVNLTTLVRVAL